MVDPGIAHQKLESDEKSETLRGNGLQQDGGGQTQPQSTSHGAKELDKNACVANHVLPEKTSRALVI